MFAKSQVLGDRGAYIIEFYKKLSSWQFADGWAGALFSIVLLERIQE